jgi:hypothetical protein
MKSAATLALLVLAGCTIAAEPDTASTDQAAIVPTGLTQVTTSCQWVAGKTCYDLTNDGNNIWPTGMGITSAYVMVRSGPTRVSGRLQTFLAFVVWNNSVVGRIFRLDVGSSDAVNFNTVVANTFAARTFNLIDTQAGSAGATSGSPSPPPHPNVEGPLTFDPAYLGAVTRHATAINDATSAFLSEKAVGID